MTLLLLCTGAKFGRDQCAAQIRKLDTNIRQLEADVGAEKKKVVELQRKKVRKVSAAEPDTSRGLDQATLQRIEKAIKTLSKSTVEIQTSQKSTQTSADWTLAILAESYRAPNAEEVMYSLVHCRARTMHPGLRPKYSHKHCHVVPYV